MPTIISICPYCKRGGVRAPDTALGGVARCPKCKSNFTVLPDDKLPEWVAKVKPEANSFAQSSSPLAETRGAPALPDKTEPSPVLPPEAKPKHAKAEVKPHQEPPVSAPAATEPVPSGAISTSLAQPQAESEDPPRAPADPGMVLALLALILFGPMVLVTQLPYGRVIAIGLGVVGLLGGLLSLGAEGKARLAGAFGAFLHFCVILVLLFLPSWLGLDPWRGSSGVKEEQKGPVAVEHGSGVAVPASPDEWLDGSKSSWQQHDTRVTVRSAVGPVGLTGPKGAKRNTKEQYLHLTLQVRHIGFEREILLSGWAAGLGSEGVRVTDATGQLLTPATFEPGWTYDRGKPAGRLMPGYRSEAFLLFAAPPAKSDFVRVQLSGSAIGVQNEIKFRVAATGAPPRGPIP
jgi:hypothetical protein